MQSNENADSVYLAVDLGASSGRVIAGLLREGKLELNVIHRFENSPVRVHQSLQWDVLGLWKEIQQGLRMASAEHPHIESVGVDTWGVDYVLVDGSDQVTGVARCYRDQRIQGMTERAFEIVPREEIFEATGLQFIDINTLYQLLAARLANDPALEIADGFLMMGDFFHWLLTGKRSIEATNASTTQLLDPRTKSWRWDLIEKFDLPSKLFTELVEPGTTLGEVQESVAATTGLSGVPVIVPATHDTASAVLAVPANDFAPAAPTWCYISSGTWSLMGCEVAEPKINSTCSELNFTNERGVSGSTRLLKNIGGLWIFQQIRKSMQRRECAHDWEEMVQLAEKAPPFQILINPDDPSLVAPTDMVDAINQLATQTGQPCTQEPGVLYRSALEGLALRYRSCLGMLETLVGNPIETIHIVGGGSLNELLCQMTADACNRPVIAGPVEATAIGNLLMQMMGTGQITGVTKARQLVRESFRTKTYQPQSPEIWEEPAERFDSLELSE